MRHIDTFFDDPYLRAGHLAGEDVTVTIDRVEAEVVGPDKAKRPVVYFTGQKKGMVLNKTNSRQIRTFYGPDTSQWTGRRITIFPTETQFKGEIVDCIRVRARVPAATDATAEEPVEEPVEVEAES